MIDKFGARRVLIFALIFMGIFFILLFWVNDFSLFLLLVALSGIGYGMINQISTKGIMLWFSSKLRATAMGIKQTGVTFGGALGAILLPAIAVSLSWHWAVAITGVLMMVVALIAVLGYRERPATDPETNKILGSSQSLSIMKDLKRLKSRPALKILCLVGALMAASQTSITSFLVLYLEEKLNFTIGAAGVCLTVLMISGAAGRVCWGIISDRVYKGDRQKPMVILCLIAFASALTVAYLSPNSPVWLCYFLGAVIGFVYMGWNALSITLCAEIAGPELAGSVTGFTSAMILTGIMIGPLIFGIIADNAGYFWGWLMLSFFSLISACLFTYSIKLASK
jgi:sugar phosphate permease